MGSARMHARAPRLLWGALLLAGLSGCASRAARPEPRAEPEPAPKVASRTQRPAKAPARKAPRGEGRAFVGEGLASFYGPGLHGNLTANGERFDQNAMTAAHRKLRFGTCLQVVNLANGRRVRVRINDRGPYIDGRIIDLSKAAARKLDMLDEGVARVRLYRCEDDAKASHRSARAG